MIIEHIAMVLLVTMVVVVCFTVFTRYFLSYTPSWGEETALLCMVWFGFLSMAMGVRDDLHLSITILDNFLPGPALRGLNLIKYACTGGYGLFMIFQGEKLVRVGMLNRFPGLQIVSAWLYAAVPIAGMAIAIFSVQKFAEILLRGSGTPDEEACGGEGGLQ